MTPEIRARIGRATEAEAHPNWGGGTWVDREGRVYIRVPKAERHLHPTIRSDGYIKRYQYVWNAAHPDDPVRLGYIVHHINEDRADDRIENLQKMTQAAHARLHRLGSRCSPQTIERMKVAQQGRRSRERE